MIRLSHHKKTATIPEKEKPVATRKPTADALYGALQSLRHLGLEPRYFNLEGVATDIKKEKPTTLEQVRIISARHFDGPDVERP